MELSERYLRENIKQKPIVENSKEVFDLLYQTMRDLDYELLKVILLNGQNQVIDVIDVFRGSITSSSVYPREIIKLGLKYSASALVLVHNHPSGIPKPSEDDKHLTRKLIFGCMTTEIEVHDHIIIGDNQYYSFADEGLVQSYEREFKRRIEL